VAYEILDANSGEWVIVFVNFEQVRPEWSCICGVEQLEHFGNGAVPLGDPRKWDLIIEISVWDGVGTPGTPRTPNSESMTGTPW